MNQPVAGNGIQALARERVLSLLRARRPQAALAMELAALVSETGSAASPLDATLTRLETEHAILVLDHSAPDPHLEGLDLRAVAVIANNAPAEQAVEAARTAADAVWSDWLRQFLATHRCT